MNLDLFAMERMQSTWENRVAFNLSESGVHPIPVGELLDQPGQLDELLRLELGYTQSNGTDELRATIARLYAGATADHVQVTNGGSEANLITTWHLVEPGDEVVMLLPNYMQTWGLVRSFGATVRAVPHRESLRWMPDVDGVRDAITDRTRLVIVCNPNNPTGACMGEPEIAAISEAAARTGAWILADEIYQGAERDGRATPSFWGRYERTIVTNGLSKAYGLPGLRIGWIVAPPPVVARLWSYHDYTTIAPSALSDRLARIALAPAKRDAILERTRGILRRNYPVVERWIAAHGDLFSYVPPVAGAIAFLRYHLDLNSTALVDRLRIEKSVLVVPGDHFGMDRYLRIGYGPPEDYLVEGLNRIDELLKEVSAREPVNQSR